MLKTRMSNPKNRLQEHCMDGSKCKPLGMPSYTTSQVFENDLPSFQSTVTVSGFSYKGNIFSTKKAAEASAAGKALISLQPTSEGYKAQSRLPRNDKNKVIVNEGNKDSRSSKRPSLIKDRVNSLLLDLESSSLDDEIVLYKPQTFSRSKTQSVKKNYLIVLDLENKFIHDKFTDEMKANSLGIFSRSSSFKFEDRDIGIKTIKMVSTRKDASDTLITAVVTKAVIKDNYSFIIVVTNDNFASNIGEAMVSLGYKTPVIHAVGLHECYAIIERLS